MTCALYDTVNPFLLSKLKLSQFEPEVTFGQLHVHVMTMGCCRESTDREIPLASQQAMYATQTSRIMD